MSRSPLPNQSGTSGPGLSFLSPQPAVERTAVLEQDVLADPRRFRVLTGDRPTGPLHIGHLFGTLLNRVRLQDLGVDVLVLVADYQTLTDRSSPETLPTDVLGLVADYLAVGIDPQRSTIFAHSQVPALNQLLVPFLSLVSAAEVGRNPTVKEEFAASDGASMSALMYTYPVHQAADILSCGANVVPVGRDQLPHLELTRTIARRFNRRYGGGRGYFAEPEALLSTTPLLLGLDGTKMSKSRGNAIPLSASADETAWLIQRARTDSERGITYEPERRPEVANLLDLAGRCLGRSPVEIASEVGGRGASGLKELLCQAVNEYLRPLRERRREVASEHQYLGSVLAAGNERARDLAEATLSEVGNLMHTRY